MPRAIDVAALLIRQRLQDIFGKVHLLAKIVAIRPKADEAEISIRDFTEAVIVKLRFVKGFLACQSDFSVSDR